MKKDREARLNSELRYHLDELIQEKIAAGFSREEARRLAILEFGGEEQLKEELRDVYRVATIENTIANLRSGIRFIRKSPSFSVAVVLTLALGIGANSAVFSAINAILLRPLPFPNSGELVMIRQSKRKVQAANTFVAPVRLRDWDRLNSTFQAISGWDDDDVSEFSGEVPEKVTEALVTPGFLQVWGVSPQLGRDFTPEEERFGGPDAVLISDRFWRRKFHADPNAVGKPIRIEQHSYSIVGVMPASFRFPDKEVDIWMPSPLDAPYAQGRELTWFVVAGRLKPGVTLAQGRADLMRVQAQLGRQFPKTDADLTIEMQPLKEMEVGGAGRSLWVLFASVSLLLLIACTNIAALLFARTAEREREISIRYSLGASRVSLVAQLLTECFVLAFIGSVIGLFVAVAGSSALRALAKSLPRVDEISLDWRIAAYTLGCAVLATLLCGLAPAIRGTRRSIASELAHASRSQVSTRNPVQWLLIGLQVALAVTLLVGAGLLLRSFEELGRVSPGFEISHILTFRISGNWGESGDMKALTRRIDRTLEELRTIPGVRGAATSVELPGIAGDWRNELKLTEGRAESEGKIVADMRSVSNGYFATMKIPVLDGEDCRPSANYADAIVVNRSFANTYFHGVSAIGYHLQLAAPNPFLPAPAEIRGIVADARERGLNREPGPTAYWCVSAPDPFPVFLIRTQGEPMAMAESIKRKIHALEPARSVYDVSPLEQHLSDSFSENRLRTMLLSLFAFTAIALVSVGLYGTLSYFVAVRRREVGLRLALGALRRQMVSEFLWKGLSVTSMGAVAGLCLAAGLTSGIRGMLYGVSPLDVETFVFVVMLVLGVAGASSLIPAIRAARVEPMHVLREE